METPNRIPDRAGPRPRTLPRPPHSQLDQNPTAAQHAKTEARLFAFPGIRREPTRISVHGAVALWLEESQPTGPSEAFMVGREFAHLHPAYDGSLHVNLPLPTVARVIAAKFGEPHPMATLGYAPGNLIMLYAPRDDAELAVIESLVAVSLRFAQGSERA